MPDSSNKIRFADGPRLRLRRRPEDAPDGRGEDDRIALPCPRPGGGGDHVLFGLRTNREPEPDGHEGLADLLIIDAIERSMRTGKAGPLDPFRPKPRPSREQELKLPKATQPKLVNAAPPGA